MNLANSVFAAAHGIIEISIILDTYEDPPSQSENLEDTSRCGLAGPWGGRRVMTACLRLEYFSG